MLLAAPAGAIKLGSPSDISGVPVTTGAILGAARAAILVPVREKPFVVLSDTEIATQIFAPYPILANLGTPRILAGAKLAIGAAE